MNKVVFLDRDGTINVDYGYVHELDKLEFVPELMEALKKIQDNGFKLIIVTNQSGIGRGYFSQEEYSRFSEKMLELMKKKGVIIEQIYTCPHTDEDKCECRKPALGLFEKAIKDYSVDLSNSYAVGDRLRDLKVCEKYPVKGILYNPDIDVVNKDDKYNSKEITSNIVEFSSWLDIANYICK